jgi:hypothetical protein
MANYVSSRDSSFLLLLAFPEVVSTFISLLGAKIGVGAIRLAEKQN